MPNVKPPEVTGVGELFRSLKNPSRDLRTRYEEDPVSLAELLHLKLPRKPLEIMRERGLYNPEIHGAILPGLRDLIEDVCLGHITSAVVVGPRGGGKSMGVAFIEFFLTFVKLYDALNLGGSELQADQVYQYIQQFVESNPYWQQLIKGEMLQSKTTTTEGAWIRVLTASSKSVRSPHAGGRKKDGRLAGGILVIDEEAEADPKIVSAALPTVNTARPSVNVRCSTFHNNEGSFAEVVDSHEEMGYKLYQWDVFDIVERCECVGVCQSQEKCFREDHVEQLFNTETGQYEEHLLHRAYCGGRAMFADGHTPVEEIEKMWRRMKRNHAMFEVEAMGTRPKSSGFVVKDQHKLAMNVVDVNPDVLYKPNYPITICVDWGTVACGISVWQEQQGDRHVCLHAEEMHEVGDTAIIGNILGLQAKYMSDFEETAADIGGGGQYFNPKLRTEYNMQVRDVNFGEEKEAAAAAFNVYNEGNFITIPSQFTEFTGQLRKWRRAKGRIQKGNDHICDSALCYFAKFVDRLGLTHVRIIPRATQAASPDPYGPPRPQENINESSVPVVLVRSIAKRMG